MCIRDRCVGYTLSLLGVIVKAVKLYFQPPKCVVFTVHRTDAVSYTHLTAGDYGAATAGYRGAATAGDSGAATAGYRGCLLYTSRCV